MKPKERFQGPMPDYGPQRLDLLINDDPVARQLFDDALDVLDIELKPITDAIEASEHITAADLAIWVT